MTAPVNASALPATASPSVLTSPLLAATLTVRSVDAAVRRYVDWLDFRLVEDGTVDAALAASWQLPCAAGRGYAVLRCASGLASHLRLVEGEPVAGFLPLRSWGWAAIEVCVQDVLAVHARLQGGPFEIIGPPNAIASLPVIHPMQVLGPDGEIVYLTEINQGGPGSGLPSARAPIDHLFIAVLGCADMNASAQWYARQLGLVVAPPLTIVYRMLNRAYGFAADRQHRLCTGERDGHLFLEFDQYPDAAVARPAAPLQAPPGLWCCSFGYPALDAVPGPWLSPPTARGGAISGGRRVGVLRAPAGELVELVEVVAEA